MEETVRWNIKVSKETDLPLRTFWGSQGMKKGDLSKFIEEAVRWRVLIAPCRISSSATPRRTRTSCRASLTAPYARVAWSVALKRRLTKPDACGARHQYSHIRTCGPIGAPGRDLRRMP